MGTNHGLESWGFMYKNAEGKPKMAEVRNVKSRQEAFDRLPDFVKANLIKPIEAYQLPYPIN